MFFSGLARQKIKTSHHEDDETGKQKKAILSE